MKKITMHKSYIVYSIFFLVFTIYWFTLLLITDLDDVYTILTIINLLLFFTFIVEQFKNIVINSEEKILYINSYKKKIIRLDSIKNIKHKKTTFIDVLVLYDNNDNEIYSISTKFFKNNSIEINDFILFLDLDNYENVNRKFDLDFLKPSFNIINSANKNSIIAMTFIFILNSILYGIGIYCFIFERPQFPIVEINIFECGAFLDF